MTTPYTTPDPTKGQRTGAQHVAYLDSRPDETSPFNPAAEYGDPDWREPASDEEATARTAWLEENTAPAPGWSQPPTTEVDDALDAARERAVQSDWAHDYDPHAWAEYRRLEALAELAPPPEQDDLADEAALESPEGDDRGPFTDTQGRRWSSTGAWAAGTCDPAKAHDTAHPDDPERLRQRIEDLRLAIAVREASAEGEIDSEQRREQLARWNDDDHSVTGADSNMQQEKQGDGEPGWDR